MEGEIRNFIAVWITALLSLCYCYTISKFIPKGKTRLCTILPVILLFFYLPLHLKTIHLGSTTAFFITWLANFKLLLFAFGKGPLSSNPPLSLTQFLLFSSLPIKVQHHQAPPNPPNPQKTQNKKYPFLQTSHKSTLNYGAKIVLLAMLIKAYNYKECIHHPRVMMVLYCLHIYITLELLLVIVAAVVRIAAQLELEPQFDEPYLATSLQDFWGKRWNLMVSSILHPTVYGPARSILADFIGCKWAPLPAIIATFLVSGLMHELIFFYTGRLRPTFEVTWFFLLHGVCLAAEIAVKRALNGKFKLPQVVAGPVVIVFVVVTSVWLFIPAFLRFEADVMAKRETAAYVEFVREVIRVASVRFRSFKVVSA